jgi:hypothetical protein
MKTAFVNCWISLEEDLENVDSPRTIRKPDYRDIIFIIACCRKFYVKYYIAVLFDDDEDIESCCHTSDCFTITNLLQMIILYEMPW